nr:reverse transcriptase domain-containing protein [Tanacetum cinerariifolium]
MRTRSQSHNNFPQQEASPAIVEPLRIELPFLKDQFQEDPPEDPPEVPMADNQNYGGIAPSTHRGLRGRNLVAKVSTSSSTPAISSEVSELKDMVRALLLDKKNQSSAPTSSYTPAPVKAIEPNCVTCGGAHSYQNCLSTSENVYRDNIQRIKVTKDQVQTPSSQSTAPVQPPVIQSETQTLVSETVVALVSVPMPNLKPSIPYPSRRDNERHRDQANEQIEKFYEIFKEMSFEISFTDALILMPKFASTLNALIGNKEELSEMARTPMNEHCLAVILNKLPRKLRDPGLSLLELTPTCMTLELTDRSVSKPIGIAKHVSVKVRVFHFPTDFVVVDFEPDPRAPLILRRCFLKTSRALIDVHKGELTLHIGNEAITYNLEVLGFSDVTASGNPTPYDDPIVAKTSHTLTLFGDSDFILFEEADAFLEVEKLLDAGLIYPISDSPWVSPVHCVPKKGGFTVVENEENELILTRLVTGWRVCIDYRKLNEATRKDHFPLPFMDLMLERLAGNEFYSFLNGFSRYFQIPIDPRDQTSRALIDVHKGELTLRIGKEAITYNLDQTVRYSANYDQMTANKIDVICAIYSQEVLSFFDVTASGSPTPDDDPIVSTTSPTLTPFGDSDFLLFEEAYDPEGDILLLEAILNSEPLPPLPNHEQYLPSYKKELKVCEAKTVKSSVDEPPEVELKDLPPHLEYVFLEGDNKLPVIIAKELGDEEKAVLIKVLKSHKRAIAWKLSDIQGKLKTRWSRPFTIIKVFPYGTVELSQANGPNFKVNGHRVKHYFGGDVPQLVVPDL